VKKIKGKSESDTEKKINEEYQIEAIDSQLKTIETQLETLEGKYDPDDNTQLILSGVVFVIFEEQETAKQVRKKWKMGPLKRFFLKLCSCLPCCSGYDYEGRILEVTRAHEPSDILWENLHCHGWDKFKRHVKTFILTFVTILICSGILFGISVGKNYSKWLSLVSSFIVVANNSILVILIKKYATEEKHKSYTEYHRSVADFLVFAQFINSAIVPFFVKIMIYYVLDDDVEECDFDCAMKILNALAYDMFFVFLSNAIVTPLTYVIDVFWYIKLQKRKQLKKNPESLNLTQAEANLIFQGTNMDIASRYASLVKTIWMTGLYAPLMPICVPISAIAIIVGYFIDKYLLLRRYVTPLQLGKEISKAMIESLEWFTLWLAVGNFMVSYWPTSSDDITSRTEQACIAGAVISIIHMALPMKKIHKCCKKQEVDTTRPDKYSEIKYTFPTDYDRANPVTQAKAEEDLLESYMNTISDKDKQ